MNILITGGTGFLGSALCQKLLAENYHLAVLSRQPRTSSHPHLQFITQLASLADLNDFDAVINLAGEPIFNKAWSAKQKNILFSSRIDLTQQIATLINHSSNPPAVFLSGSATGYYGNLDSSADENAPASPSFTGKLCNEWEQAALQAQVKTRVCLLRTGLVLDPKGGMMKPILPLYRFGLGGKLGNGKQFWAWISLDDYLQAVIFLLQNAKCTGAFNMVAPTPLPQAEFNRLLAKQLHRPAFCHAPAFLLKMLLGERAQLLLDNQPLMPTKLQQAGFTFSDNQFTDWLKKLGC
jgi:uncharacterized protein (TIGR01777 family)